LVRYIEENGEEPPTLHEEPPRAYLALLVEGRISHTFPLRGEIALGREKGNAIVVADQKVSRHHARLAPIDDSFILIDQGSANGTYVNGVLIAQPTRLQNNDRIGIGDATFLFTTGQPDSKAVSQPSSAATMPPVVRTPASGSLPLISNNNRSIWMAIGCMALAILALLIILALILGVFVGRHQLGLAWLELVLGMGWL